MSAITPCTFSPCLRGLSIFSNNRLVAGVDEAGRGPLAGPVVAGAVIFLSPPSMIGIKDSKKLTFRVRERLLLKIYRHAMAVGVGIVWPSMIDKINIHSASLMAMEKAIKSLNPQPGLLLIDGPFNVASSLPQLPIIKGDSLSISIAAASIVAKTFRDRVMHAYDETYPSYGFARNKGYATLDHRRALASFGPSPIHRRSFRLQYPE